MTRCLGAAAVEKEAIDTQNVTKYRSREEGGRKDTQKSVWAQQKLKRQLTHRRKAESIDGVERLLRRSVRDTESWRFTTG